MTELAQCDVFRMPAAPALPTVAVARLPCGELGVDELDQDPFWRLSGLSRRKTVLRPMKDPRITV